MKYLIKKQEIQKLYNGFILFFTFLWNAFIYLVLIAFYGMILKMRWKVVFG